MSAIGRPRDAEVCSSPADEPTNRRADERARSALLAPLHLARVPLRIFTQHLRLLARRELALARLGLFTLQAVLLVPLTRDLTGELAVAQPERQRHRQRDRPEQNPE